jgi:hypothetical protein
MCSSLRVRSAPAGFAAVLAAVLAPAVLAPTGALAAQSLPTADEALQLAFPGAKIERTTAALDDAQRARMQKELKQDDVPHAVFPYVARRDGVVVGTVYFDSHRVRQQRETLMVVVKPDGTLGRVEVVAFGEPKEYLPRRPFYEQFPGRGGQGAAPLDKDLKLVAGATLTTQATIAACQRVLAVHRVLQAPAGGDQGGEKGTDKGNDKGGDKSKPPAPPAPTPPASGGGEEHR